MISSTIAVPHPILGRPGDFVIDAFPLRVNRFDIIDNQGVFGFEQLGDFPDDFREQLRNGAAELGIEVFCPGRFVRVWLPISIGRQTDQVFFEDKNLGGVLLATPLIVWKRATKMSFPSASRFYEGRVFDLKPGDVSGQGQTERFVIEDDKAAEALLSVRLNKELPKNSYGVEFGHTITIEMGESVFRVFNNAYVNPGSRPLIFMSVIKDALFFALKESISGEIDSDLPGWREALMDRAAQLGVDLNEIDNQDEQELNRIAMSLIAKETIETLLRMEADNEVAD